MRLSKPIPRWSIKGLLAATAIAAVGCAVLRWYRLEQLPLRWTPFSTAVFEKAAGSGKPVLVSVIADWDISVHALKHRLEKPAMRRMLRQRGFVLLEANLTDWNSPLVDEIKTLIASNTPVPAIAVYTPRGGVARLDLPGSMSEAEFMEAIELAAHLTRRNSGRERK